MTVNYADGTEIQVLPAVRRATGGVRIADPVSGSWSNVTRPDNFARKLVEVNQARSGRVTPTIKLAKAIADCFIRKADHKIKGYHMESLAIEAFRNYQGSLDNRAMLNRLVQNSVSAVMSPIADSTGQSRCVDEYLGEAGSRSRRRASTHFGQMRGKINSCQTEARNWTNCSAAAARPGGEDERPLHPHSGSASRDCPEDRLQAAIRFVETFTEDVLKRGGGIVVLAGAEDSTRNEQGTPLIFDWIALRTVERFAQRTTVNPHPYARVVMSDQAPENKIDDANLMLLANLEQRNVLEVTRIRREVYTGGAYRAPP